MVGVIERAPLGLGQDGRNVAKGAQAFIALRVKGQAMAGGQAADAAIKRVGLGNMAPKKKTDVPGRFRRSVNLAASKQRLDLRRGAESFAIVRPVQRLDAERVAREEKDFFPPSQMAKANMPRNFSSMASPYSA